MKPVEQFKLGSIRLTDVVLVATSDPGYSMTRTILVENYPEYGQYCLIQGGHCSCYGFDETTWAATIYDAEELAALATGWLEHGCFEERVIAPQILAYVREGGA